MCVLTRCRLRGLTGCLVVALFVAIGGVLGTFSHPVWNPLAQAYLATWVACVVATAVALILVGVTWRRQWYETAPDGNGEPPPVVPAALPPLPAAFTPAMAEPVLVRETYWDPDDPFLQVATAL